jgi:fatty acid desaturase
LARYAVGLLLFVIGWWAGMQYRAGEGPFVWFMLFMLLTCGALWVGVMPDIVAWRFRRASSRLDAENNRSAHKPRR